jgi:hypothetical protein
MPPETIPQPNPAGPGKEEGRQFPIAFAAGAVIVALVIAGLVLMSRGSRPAGAAAEAKLPFGPAEQAYAEHIHFNGLQMAKANNFLNQEFTYVAGTTSNDGARTIRGLTVAMEFRDPFNQVVLREDETLIGTKDQSLGGGQRRDFQVTLEHVPAEWNQQYPNFRVTGLVLGD